MAPAGIVIGKVSNYILAIHAAKGIDSASKQHPNRSMHSTADSTENGLSRASLRGISANPAGSSARPYFMRLR